MHLSTFVVMGRMLLQASRNKGIVYNNRTCRRRLRDQIEDIQQLPRIAAAITQQSISFFQLYLLLF